MSRCNPADPQVVFQVTADFSDFVVSKGDQVKSTAYEVNPVASHLVWREEMPAKASKQAVVSKIDAVFFFMVF